jgi:ankyrin repeat protein
VPEAIEILLNQGALIDTPSDRGLTPLHAAALICNVVTIEYLIKCRACVNARDNTNRTPLHCAVCSIFKEAPNVQEKVYNVVALLLQNGADPAAEDVNGKKPVDFVINPKVKALLENWGKQQTC